MAIVFHDDDGVADSGEVFENSGEQVGVAGMETDGRFVKHVESADQSGAELIGQGDALGFSPRKRFCLSGQREIAEADPLKEPQLGLQLAENIGGNLLLERPQRQGLHPAQQARNCLFSDLVNVGAGDLHEAGIRLQPAAVTGRAFYRRTIATEQHAHVQLVALPLHVFKEVVDTIEGIVAFPH